MSLEYFKETRKIYMKYHETACRPLIKYYVDARRAHAKKGDREAANAEDIQMRKWLMDVATILNANIYVQLKISQECFDNSNIKYREQLFHSSNWKQESNAVRHKVSPPDAPKEMTLE